MAQLFSLYHSHCLLFPWHPAQNLSMPHLVGPRCVSMVV